MHFDQSLTHSLTSLAYCYLHESHVVSYSRVSCSLPGVLLLFFSIPFVSGYNLGLTIQAAVIEFRSLGISCPTKGGREHVPEYLHKNQKVWPVSFLSFLLATRGGMQDLSSLTRDQTCAPCSEAQS